MCNQTYNDFIDLDDSTDTFISHTEALCTSLKNISQWPSKQRTLGPLLFVPWRINDWTVTGSTKTLQQVICWQTCKGTLSADGWIKDCNAIFSFSLRSQHIHHLDILLYVTFDPHSLSGMVTSRTSCCAGSWRAPLVLWLSTTAASTSDTLSRWLPPGLTWWYFSPGI